VTLCPARAQISGGMLAICGCFGERTGGPADNPPGHRRPSTVAANSRHEVTDVRDEVEAASEAQRGRASEDAPEPIHRQVPGSTTGTCICSEEVPR
jgi:hypothetical protein